MTISPDTAFYPDAPNQNRSADPVSALALRRGLHHPGSE
ncbi:hypothetical protein BN2364_3883 [Alloalcanivorax xenomutans]|nr:hypothetical protein BN2364_3883 [Alloalcanivorax xenomutans]